MKINLKEKDFARKVISRVIANNDEIYNKLKKGTWERDIVLTIDGIELDFLEFLNFVDEAVLYESGNSYTDIFDTRANEIREELDEIYEKLKYIRKSKFPELSWWD